MFSYTSLTSLTYEALWMLESFPNTMLSCVPTEKTAFLKLEKVAHY